MAALVPVVFVPLIIQGAGHKEQPYEFRRASVPPLSISLSFVLHLPSPVLFHNSSCNMTDLEYAGAALRVPTAASKLAFPGKPTLLCEDRATKASYCICIYHNLYSDIGLAGARCLRHQLRTCMIPILHVKLVDLQTC